MQLIAINHLIAQKLTFIFIYTNFIERTKLNKTLCSCWYLYGQ